jgi:hypothetical protein
MVRIVRTSTVEVDRRIFERYDLGLSCRVELSGRGSFAVQLKDLSEGGAKATGLPDLAPGTRGDLSVEGLAAPVSFKVLGMAEEVAHLAFEPNPAGTQALRSLLARLGQERAS